MSNWVVAGAAAAQSQDTRKTQSPPAFLSNSLWDNTNQIVITPGELLKTTVAHPGNFWFEKKYPLWLVMLRSIWLENEKWLNFPPNECPGIMSK